MLKILAHRGYWLTTSEKNSKIAFQRAVEHGFGIETDFRDNDSNVVISHDIPDSNCLNLDEFINIISTVNSNITLAINVKSDGLQSLFNKNKELKMINHFFFDMSVPDCFEYKKYGCDYYTRYSDIEPNPNLYKDSKGVWFDNFSSNFLDLNKLEEFILDNKEVALVSPELHGYEYKPYWLSLKDFLNTRNNIKHNIISLCTDYPAEAREFFYE